MAYSDRALEGARGRGVPIRSGWRAVLLMLLSAAYPAAAQKPVQIFYVPLPEEEILTAFLTLDTSTTPLAGDTTIRTVIGITATQTGTLIYYDHWENDFDPEIDDPADLYSAGNLDGTQIWGDGDPSNGAPPGYPSDLITAGDVLVLDNNVPASPRVPTDIFFDGGDKMATTWPIAVTRAAWPVPGTGTVIAGALEVFPTRDWGSTFEAPGGENLATTCATTNGTDDSAAFCMFQDSRLLIMARQDGTQVTVDVDGDGIADLSRALEEGESMTVDGAQAGSEVLATAPVQVNELTGDIGARFEARWFALVPRDQWSDTYVAPVGTTVNPSTSNDNAVVVAYNPGPAAVTVSVDQLTGCTELALAAGATGKVVVAWNGDPATNPLSGARLSTTGALATPGLDCTGDAATGGAIFALAAIDDEATTHDWGHTLLPEESLSIDLKVGWAPGSNGAENSSPLWIASLESTNVCVDFDDDGTPDLIDTDGDGVGDTLTLACPALATVRVFEPDVANGGDGDQTGTRVFSTTDTTCSATSPKDGALLAGAWGQDPATASPGNPALDLGTTVLQVPPIILAKEGSLAVDVNGNGLIDPGDALRYTIGVLNSGTSTAVDVTLTDTLDPNTAYIVNSTTRDGVPVADDTSPATPFPLDEGGLNLGNLGPGVRVEIRFLVEVDPNLPPGTGAIVNQAVVTTGGGESSDDSASAPVFDGNPRVSKLSNVSGTVIPGDTITYSIAPRSDGLELQTNFQVSDAIPANTTYVGGSALPTPTSGPDPLIWNLGSNVAGTPGSTAGGYLCSDVVDLPVSRDTYVRLGSPENGENFGGSTVVQTRPAGSGARQGLMGFDLSAIPAGATISSAALTVTSRNSVSDQVIEVRQATAAWTEGTLNGSTCTSGGDNGASWLAPNCTDTSTGWDGVGGDFGSGPYGSTVYGTLVPDATQQSVTVTGLVQDWVDGSSANNGVVLLATGTSTSTAEWGAREDGTSSRHAFLDVTYQAPSLGATTSTSMITEGTLVTGGDTVTVTMTLTSNSADTNVTPGTLSVAGTSGASATCGTPSPASQSISADTPITFVWTCTANAGATPGSVTFSADGVGDASSYASASSNSVLVSPPLNFQVTVDNPLDANVGTIVNTAEITSDQQPDPNKSTVVDAVDNGALIGDSVWLDTDGDGIQDIGEAGLANVRVELFADPDGVPGNGDEVLIASATTDAMGRYAFHQIYPLASGNYYVDVDESTLPAGLEAAPGNNNGISNPITVTGELEYRDADFGYRSPGGPSGTGVIGDYIWSDADGDGVQDAGEPGIGNVTVELMGPGPDGVLGTADDQTVSTTSTTADGRYLFTGVAPGHYQVAVTDVGGWLIGYVPTTGPQSVGGYLSSPVTVVSGGVASDVDFGFENDAGLSISDRVWLDADGDGSADAGEMGAAGVTVNLLSDPDGVPNNGDEVVIATAVTDANGDFSFGGVRGGADYVLEITDTADVLRGGGGTTAAARAGSLAIPNLSGDVSGVNFGYNALSALFGTVWNDADGDGIRDAAEIGLGGVTVELRDDICTPAIDCPVTSTDAGGFYFFRGLEPDLYTVVVTDTGAVLSGYTQTGDPDEPGTCSICDASSTAVVNLSTGQQFLDFGYQNGALDDISGTLFDDEDANGVHNVGEGGLAGVTVALLDDAGSVLTSTTTDANGAYVFPDLPAGTYSVRVTDQTGVLDGYRLTSGLDELPAQPGDSDVDFGYTRDSTTGSIGSRVWLEIDLDGAGTDHPNGRVDPTEAGISGVQMDLYRDQDADGVLEPTVSVVDGRIDLDGDGNVDADDSGVLGALRVIDGALDINDDGVIDAADDGAFNGVTVIDGLLDLDNDGTAGETNGNDTGTLAGDDGTAVATTVTDANGDYAFPGLSAGSFFVDLDETTLPATTPGDLVETIYPGVPPSTVIALSVGERYGDADFGYLPRTGTAVLGDRVWYDADGDGLQDPGEIGIGGVDIDIYGPGCSSCTMTTGPDGSWLVTGLAPGEYSVSFDAATLPAGSNTTPTNLGGDDTYNLTVVAGDVVTQLDFGFGGGTTATLGDRIWRDEDGDGVEDPGEPGIAGVTVNLLDASGNILATTTSAADGSYEFSGVPDGSHTVSLSDLDGVLVGLQQTYDPDETGICVTCDAAGSVAVSAGVSTPADVDFGFAPSGGTGTIGDSVWHDVDGDGVQDAGESGIQGVSLELWLDADNDGVITPGTDNLVRTAVTDQNGEYGFSSLPDGNYIVRVTDTAGVVSSFDQTGDPDEGGTCVTCDGQGVLVLAGGSGDFDQDFGYAAPVGMSYDISGSVFDDQNQDGIFDDPGESGVVGALVLLFSDLDGDGVLDADEPLIGTTASDASGNYLLEDLPPGDYLVAVDTTGTAVDGYVQTTQVATAGLQPVTIVDTQIADQDFGFWSGGLITTPVTLAYFRSEGSGTVRFEWGTATETANLGFHLYELTAAGLRRIHETLLPSQVGDALTPQRYTLEAWGVEGDLFVLEDVDLFGQKRYHGPFKLGQSYGREIRDLQRTDWTGIRRQHERLSFARQQRRAAAEVGRRLRTGLEVASAGGVQLRVRDSGLYRVTYEALLAAGIDLAGVPLARLALLEAGEPVPIRVEGRGQFGPGSFLEFVGRPLDTLYTDTNVYTLMVAPEMAERVRRIGRWVPPAVPTPEFYYETRTVEVNRAYDFAAPGEDPWYDARLLAISDPVEASFALELDDRLPGAGSVELTVGMWGVTNFPGSPDHHVVIEVNGVELADEWFDGLADHPVEVEIPEWVLAAQGNSLRLRLPHDTGALYDLVHYDFYRVRYPRRFEAVDGRLSFTAAAPAFRVDGLPSADVVVYRQAPGRVEVIDSVQISGVRGDFSATFAGGEEPATYLVSTSEALRVPELSLAAPSQPDLTREARMLIIAHPDFIDGVEPLVAERRSEGLSVQVVNVEDLYQQFSYGVFDPSAVKAAIAQAHGRQGTEYVLLVGGDTYDYRDHLGQGSISFIPTLYTRTDRIVHFAPVDPLFGDVDDDGVPDVSVGRWPVRTTAELGAVVDKTLQYAEVDYLRTAVMAADAFDAPSGYSFKDASEELLGYLPATWQATRVYLDDLSLEDARQALIDGINTGVALTSYFGHSGPSVWSFDGLFDSRDADALENFSRPTVVTQWGCWNTYHVMPTYDTLGHRLLLNEDRGAAAVLGAATLTEASSEQLLGRRLFAEIGGKRLRLGQALIHAKRDLAATDPGRLDVLLGWTLLGDPTLVVEP